MQLKTFAISALAATLVAGCGANQTAVKSEASDKGATKSAPVKAKAKAKPAVIAGASGAMLASTCEGCHGTDGASTGPATPSIGGMSEDYLIEAMEEFRDGDTQSTIMGRIAKGYTDAEIVAMSEYYAGVDYVGVAQSADSSTVAKGEQLHNKYCDKCHHDGGSDASDDSGILAGQWAPYLQYTMEDFMNGDRDVGRKMKKKIDILLAKEGQSGLNAIISYYSSQH